MSDRYTISAHPKQVSEYFRFELPSDYEPRYNAAPAQLLPVVTLEAPKGFSFFYWGTIPGWSGNKTISKKLLAISSEEAISKQSVGRLLRLQRCLIPCDGFYLWKRVGKKSRIPYRVVLRDRSLFCIAGIWEEFEDENDQNFHTFRMISTDAPDNIHFLSDQIPLIMEKENQKKWMDPGISDQELIDLMKPFPGGKLDFYTVSPHIENSRIDHDGLIKPASSMDQFGNYSLFD